MYFSVRFRKMKKWTQYQADLCLNNLHVLHFYNVNCCGSCADGPGFHVIVETEHDVPKVADEGWKRAQGRWVPILKWLIIRYFPHTHNEHIDDSPCNSSCDEEEDDKYEVPDDIDEG